MPEKPEYDEQISSNKTTVLFLALTILFFLCLTWRVSTVALDVLSIAFGCLFVLFLFYTVNYKSLRIHISPTHLNLRFGIFSWVVPLDNIESCGIDNLPAFMRMGGAGIHFMLIHKRYRASFNFLEYPRVVIALKQKNGPVRDISFSTRHPAAVMQFIRQATATPGTSRPRINPFCTNR